MANEIDITELTATMWRGDLIVFSHNTAPVGQQIDANATQDDSAAFAETTNLISVLNNHSAKCNIRIWDATDTITTANSQPIGAGQRLEFLVKPGQIISSKIV